MRIHATNAWAHVRFPRRPPRHASPFPGAGLLPADCVVLRSMPAAGARPGWLPVLRVYGEDPDGPAGSDGLLFASSPASAEKVRASVRASESSKGRGWSGRAGLGGHDRQARLRTWHVVLRGVPCAGERALREALAPPALSSIGAGWLPRREL